jgi:nucleotide-binding universal stress UspA family protein
MKILLAVDGSDSSFDAVRALSAFGPSEQLIVANVMDLPQLSYPSFGPNINQDLALTVQQAMKEEGTHFIDRAVSLLPPHHGPVTKRLEEGSPAEGLLRIAEEEKVDLIVVGARGLGPVKEYVFGSVSHRVVIHAPCSTLVVKVPLREVNHILIPVEGEEDANVTAEFLKKNPFRTQPKVTVVHVVPYTDPVWPVGAMIPESFRQDMLTQGQNMANKMVSTLQPLGYQVEGKAVIGVPSYSIVSEAGEKKVDMILMPSNNRTRMSRFFLGSVSHGVLHSAPCSVLLIR